MSVFTQQGFNVTYLSLSGHVELHKYKYLYFLILLMVYIFTVISGTIVLFLIFTHKTLQEPMYVFIAALLLNNLLVSTTIHPKLLSDFLSENQLISFAACVLQGVLVNSLGFAGFTLLSAMAYDRYVSICKPLQYPIIMRTDRVRMLLVLAWVIPFCVAGGPAFSITRMKLCRFELNMIFCDPSSVSTLSCGNSRAFQLYGLFLISLVGLSVVFIIFTYTKILTICLQSSKDVKKKAVQTCLPHLLVLFNHTVLTAFLLKNRLESDFQRVTRFILTFQILLFNPVIYPIIYGLKMTEIYKCLKRLFCESCSAKRQA